MCEMSHSAGIATNGAASMSPQRCVSWCIAILLPAGVLIVSYLLGAQKSDNSVLVITATATLAVLLTVSTVTDLSTQRIPNWITYPSLLWAVGLNSLVSISPDPPLVVLAESTSHSLLVPPIGLSPSLLGAFVCFLLMLVSHSATGGSAGDVKLATAIGAFLGVHQGMLAICFSFVVAGVVCLAIAIWVLGPLDILRAFGRRIGALFIPMVVPESTPEQEALLGRPIPMGLFFACGTLMTRFDWVGVL